jgi:hypothetical protein
MERKVEEAITVSNHNLEVVQTRTSRLEEMVRDSELSLRDKINLLKEEVNI